MYSLQKYFYVNLGSNYLWKLPFENKIMYTILSILSRNVPLPNYRSSFFCTQSVYSTE